ncbi:MAG: dipicolinate synthase subunit B [Clostridiales bacterium]|nr:dipicolinate synthase subunit B [Clostridiales bacterium]
MIGYAFCGSFCTLQKSLKVLRSLTSEGNSVLPIMSNAVYETDTRFGKAADFVKTVENICGRDVVHTIVDAEPLGPRSPLDMLVISPCTGNTLAKIASGITDTPVTMAAKAHLRSDRPLVIALATNDALSGNFENIASLMKRKNVFFVPMEQDDPKNKPHSLVCDFERTGETMMSAFAGRQIEPVIAPHLLANI